MIAAIGRQTRYTVAMRWVFLAGALAACSSENTSRAELAGTWRGARAGSPPIELRADGSVDMPLTTDPACADDPGIAGCKARARWDRRGDRVRLWPAMLVASAPGGGSFAGMFAGSPGPGAGACVCKVDPEPTFVEIRDRDTLAVGDEVIARVR